MAIYPVGTNPDGSFAVWHDERDHGGTAPAGQPLLSGNGRELELRCPVSGCGAISYHPISGGARLDEVQPVFVKQLLKDSKRGLKDEVAALAFIAEQARLLDGPRARAGRGVGQPAAGPGKS